MSRVAFVLVRAVSGREGEVREALAGAPHVTEVHGLFGEFDLIARLEVADTAGVMDAVIRHVRPLPGVVDTETLLTTSLGEPPRAPRLGEAGVGAGKAPRR